MDRRTLLLSGGVAVLGGGAYFLTRPGADGLPVNPLAGAANAQSADPSSIPDMILGDPEAPVEVIEYASYTCPHCASLQVWYTCYGGLSRKPFFHVFGLLVGLLLQF